MPSVKSVFTVASVGAIALRGELDVAPTVPLQVEVRPLSIDLNSIEDHANEGIERASGDLPLPLGPTSWDEALKNFSNNLFPYPLPSFPSRRFNYSNIFGERPTASPTASPKDDTVSPFLFIGVGLGALGIAAGTAAVEVVRRDAAAGGDSSISRIVGFLDDQRESL